MAGRLGRGSYRNGHTSRPRGDLHLNKHAHARCHEYPCGNRTQHFGADWDAGPDRYGRGKRYVDRGHDRYEHRDNHAYPDAAAEQHSNGGTERYSSVGQW